MYKLKTARYTLSRFLKSFTSASPARPRVVHALTYKASVGQKSPKAQRLVEFCLGEFIAKPAVKFQNDRSYWEAGHHLRMKITKDEIELSANLNSPSGRLTHVIDQKRSIDALLADRVAFSMPLEAWVVRGDAAGAASNTALGPHFAAARHHSRKDIILLPFGNRDRAQGAALPPYMASLQKDWTAWDKKSDTVWWGGAVTGANWKHRSPDLLRRSQLVNHFTQNSDPRVVLRPTQDSSKQLEHPKLYPNFTKAEAFKHKAIMLMPGNDAPSGAVWYFAGNSVVMMPEAPIDYILGFELTPWEHYIPVGPDPQDVLVKLQWVLDNPQKAQQIVRAAHQNLRWHSGDEYIWAMNTVLAEAGAHIQKTA